MDRSWLAELAKQGAAESSASMRQPIPTGTRIIHVSWLRLAVSLERQARCLRRVRREEKNFDLLGRLFETFLQFFGEGSGPIPTNS